MPIDETQGRRPLRRARTNTLRLQGAVNAIGSPGRRIPVGSR